MDPIYTSLIPVSEWIDQGDLVIFQGKTYKITKVNPKNYKLEDEAGRTYNLRRTAAVTKAPAGTTFNAPEKPVYDTLHAGNVVKFTNVSSQRKFGYGKFVVLKSLNDDRYQLVKLNGDGGRYVNGVHRSNLELTTAE